MERISRISALRLPKVLDRLFRRSKDVWREPKRISSAIEEDIMRFAGWNIRPARSMSWENEEQLIKAKSETLIASEAVYNERNQYRKAENKYCEMTGIRYFEPTLGSGIIDSGPSYTFIFFEPLTEDEVRNARQKAETEGMPVAIITPSEMIEILQR